MHVIPALTYHGKLRDDCMEPATQWGRLITSRYRCLAVFSNSSRAHPLALIPNYLYPKQIFPSFFPQSWSPCPPLLSRWSCLPKLVKLIRTVHQKLPSSLLETLDFSNSLFTSYSVKAIGILLLQNFITRSPYCQQFPSLPANFHWPTQNSRLKFKNQTKILVWILLLWFPPRPAISLPH